MESPRFLRGSAEWRGTFGASARHEIFSLCPMDLLLYSDSRYRTLSSGVPMQPAVAAKHTRPSAPSLLICNAVLIFPLCCYPVRWLAPKILLLRGEMREP